MNPFVTVCMWLYRRLARGFPHEFQIVYGADVIQLGEDAIDAIWEQHGFFGLLRLIADISVRVPVEYLAEMRRDLIYSLRTLAKSRGFAAVGIISLGLGIGVTAVSASQYFSMILRDTPGAENPDELVMLQGCSYPYFEHYRDQHDLFTGAAAFQNAIPFNVSLQGANAKAERIYGQLVSPEYFSVLGVKAARGRLLSPEMEKPGSAPVIFISDRFWRNRLNSDADAIGRTIRVNGQAAMVVGIGPKDFLGALPFIPADLFVPTTSPASLAPELAGDVIHKRDMKSFGVLLRRAPGVTTKAAEAGLDAITRNLDQETLDPARNAKGRRIQILPGGKILPIPRETLPVIAGFTVLLNGLIMLIASMNLANMQLARATARRREVAIRLAVGASRFRLIRQLLTESVLLALFGGAAGLAFAFWAASAFKRVKLPYSFPVNFDMTPDWHVMTLTFALAMVAGVGFGLAPALATTRTDLASTLKEGALAQMRGYRRFGMRNLLMVGQVAGSLTLLLIAGFIIIGFNKTSSVEIAFDPNTMYLVSFDPVRDGYSAEQAANLFDTLPDRLKRAPDVQEVVLATAPPFAPHAGIWNLSAPADAGMPEQLVRGVAKSTIGANYFAALNVNMLAGREFDLHDQRTEPSPGKALPAILDQTAAQAFFGNGDPIGRRISDTGKSYEVVGVVKDLSAPMSQTGRMGSGPMAIVPVVYLPFTRSDFAHPPGGGMIVMIRARGGTDAMQSVRAEIAAIDPNLVLFNVRSLAEQVADTDRKSVV
jgi:predicted permease